MPNPENLKKGKATQFKAGEEQAKIARQGGIASGKAKREKADFKKKCQIWMDETIVGHDDKGNPLTGSELMIYVAGRGIAEGNTSFWQLMRDTAGYKPVDKVIVAEVEQATIDEVEGMVLGSGTTEAAADQEAENGQQGCE